MRRGKSGKDIVDHLYRQISTAGDDLRKLESEDADGWRCQSGRHALSAMQSANRLLSDLISELPAPQRPRKRAKPNPTTTEPQ